MLKLPENIKTSAALGKWLKSIQLITSIEATQVGLPHNRKISIRSMGEFNGQDTSFSVYMHDRFGNPGPAYTLNLNQIARLSVKLEDFDNLIKQKNEELLELQNKIDYMKENNVEEFDEEQYKVYRALETMENQDLDRHEQASIITKLFIPQQA